MVRFYIPILLVLPLAACVNTGSSPMQASKASGTEPLSILVSSGDADIFDPTQSAQATFTLRHSFFCYPLRLSAHSEFLPDAVQSWAWSKDQKELTLVLDPKRRFHNGKEITAADLEFALVRPFLATRGEVGVDLNIRGAGRVKSGDRFQSGMIEGIRIQGPKTLTVSLEKPNPDFLYRLTSMSSQMMLRENLEDDYATFKGTPISCGDYRVTDISPGRERVRLEKFAAIADAPDRVELWNYDYKKLPSRPDLMLGGLFPLKELDRSYYRRQDTEIATTLMSFVVNDKAALNHYPAFRRAIDLALPRAEIAKSRDDAPTRDFVGQLSPVHLGRPIVEDLEEAEKLWLTLPKELREKEYKIYMKTNYPGPYFAMIDRNLQKIGMKVHMVAKQMKNFEQVGDDALLLGVGVIILSTGPIAMYQRFDTRNPKHDPFPAFAQAGLRKRIDRHQETLDPKARLEAARELAQFVLEQNLVIPLTYGASIVALSPRVKSYGGTRVSGIDVKLIR